MDRRRFLTRMFAGAAGLAASTTSPFFLTGCAGRSIKGAPTGRRPNILLIMADDMGFSDIGCYGGEIHTPNLDRLAARGLRFTQFYNTARCCPTRASLMTGLYPHQGGMGEMTFDKGMPGARGFLTPNTVTIAELLRDADYRTAMAGKWHLSQTSVVDNQLEWLNHRKDYGDFSDPATYPVGRGFEEHYGTIWGVGDYFDPFSLVHNTEVIREVPAGYYYTDAITEHAVRYINKYSQGGDPFLLYVAYTAPHWPLHALPEDIVKYKDAYQVGWDAIRETRYRRMLELGLFDAATTPLPQREDAERTWAGNPNQEWDARAMAVHAAMIDRMDQGIGRIVAELGCRNLLDDTLIIFLSDNGASPEQPRRPGFDRPSATRDGRVMHYRGENPVPPGSQNTFYGIGQTWANTANTPFRYWKALQHEGGICTPLIVHWPGGLKTELGAVTDQPGHVMDIMATCIDIAGVEYPAVYQGRRITPLEGKSLCPIFRGRQRDGHEAIFFEHFRARGVICGDWKLVLLRDGQEWELYNLATDRTETNNLVARYPQKVMELAAMWHDWARRCQVPDTRTLEERKRRKKDG